MWLVRMIYEPVGDSRVRREPMSASGMSCRIEHSRRAKMNRTRRRIFQQELVACRDQGCARLMSRESNLTRL